MYIVVKGTITVAGTNVNNITNKMIAFKSNALFRSRIQKVITHS